LAGGYELEVRAKADVTVSGQVEHLHIHEHHVVVEMRDELLAEVERHVTALVEHKRGNGRNGSDR
jgi:hypothetical protein